MCIKVIPILCVGLCAFVRVLYSRSSFRLQRLRVRSNLVGNVRDTLAEPRLYIFEVARRLQTQTCGIQVRHKRV